MASKQRKLVLHIDVNNTMLIGDTKTKLTSLEGIVNEYMTEIVWGTIDGQGAWEPVQNPISIKPATPESITYYKYAEAKFAKAGKPRSEFKDHARQFTFEDVGKQFRPYVEKVKESLRCKSILNGELIEPLLLKETDGVYYRIVSSFFKLLIHLMDRNRDFTIILRTFGGDGETALQAIKVFTKGLHPLFPFPRGKSLEISFTAWEITGTDGGLHVKIPGEEMNCPEKVYALFSQCTGVQLCLDNYDWWKNNGFVSAAGKPLLVDPKDPAMQHILFDDNIRAWDPTDNIVHLLVKGENGFQSCDPQEFDDSCLVRTDLFESILNENYFVEKLQTCEENYEKYVETH